MRMLQLQPLASSGLSIKNRKQIGREENGGKPKSMLKAKCGGGKNMCKLQVAVAARG